MGEKKHPSTAESALLELVHRLNQAINAWKDDANEPRENKTRPDWAWAVPDAPVGSVFYYCHDLTCPLSRYLIVAKDAEGYARTVWLQDRPVDAEELKDESSIIVGWLGEAYPTAEEAVRVEARAQLEQALAWQRQARAALDALERGEDWLKATLDASEEEKQA